MCEINHLDKFRTTFICPDCQSEEWGTDFPQDVWDLKKATGRCAYCGYEWSRKDDEKVFSFPLERVLRKIGPYTMYGETKYFAIPENMKVLFSNYKDLLTTGEITLSAFEEVWSQFSFSIENDVIYLV